jgi:hypothetical protein
MSKRPSQVTRRQLLQWGGALSCGGLSFGLGPSLASIARGADLGDTGRTGTIRSCIFVFYYGGPSHLDTYDMKPTGPTAIRGEFQPIQTTVPGLQICEHLPHMARQMHHCALIRSMRHTNRLHDSASIETHTGRQAAQGDREEFAPIPQFFPCHGAAVHHQSQAAARVVQHAALPYVFNNVIPTPCQGGGFLGSTFDPFRISVDPEKQSYSVQELIPQAELPVERMRRRSDLLTRVQPDAGSPGQLAALDRFYNRALELLGAADLQELLDLSRESEETRRRYGLYPNGQKMLPNETPGGPNSGFGARMRGQNLLLARRLVEAGVPFVNVYDYRQQGVNWDTHEGNFTRHKNDLLPPADQALAALIADLDERGLLESTLVVATGEFGRTPVINASAGRDHWPDCYTVLLAGGGVVGGAIHGASDASGAYPARDPVSPADLAATLYWRFGIDPRTHILDRTGRPWHLSDGEPLRNLFGAS